MICTMSLSRRHWLLRFIAFLDRTGYRRDEVQVECCEEAATMKTGHC